MKKSKIASGLAIVTVVAITAVMFSTSLFAGSSNSNLLTKQEVLKIVQTNIDGEYIKTDFQTQGKKLSAGTAFIDVYDINDNPLCLYGSFDV